MAQIPAELTRWTTIAAALLAIAPVIGFGFFGERWKTCISALPLALRIALPSVACIPYLLVALPLGRFRWGWCLLYVFLPIALALLLMLVARLDPEQRGHWLEFAVLLVLGLAVDLRWFEVAWPHLLAAINKLLLLDAGLYGFLAIRQLSGVGFDLRLRSADWKTGLREWLFCAPIVIVLGLALGFLHWHRHPGRLWLVPLTWIFTFLCVALPEEIYFRGWMQNLLERRIGRRASLFLTSAIFGLAHFNKRTLFFNWRYVLLAVIAGIFYGRAWRAERRVGASAITHTTVDTLWGAVLR